MDALAPLPRASALGIHFSGKESMIPLEDAIARRRVGTDPLARKRFFRSLMVHPRKAV